MTGRYWYWMDDFVDGIGLKSWIAGRLDGYGYKSGWMIGWMNERMDEWFGSKVFIHHNT